MLPPMILLLPLLLASAYSSSSDGSRVAQYEQAISQGETALAELLETHPDVVTAAGNVEISGCVLFDHRHNQLRAVHACVHWLGL